MLTFERPHHQRIAQILNALNGPLLRENKCLFGGGTAIVLRFGEYRESVDIDFLISDLKSYRTIRQLLTGPRGIAAITRDSATPLTQTRELRADQYGIRTILQLADLSTEFANKFAIKFEIVLEGRIQLATPSASDVVCGVATLTPLDMAASKLMANSDRWFDDGVFSRDLIDLAMMNPPSKLLREAVKKAEAAYGPSIRCDLEKALKRLQERNDWLERCMQALAIKLPKVAVWQRLRGLGRILPNSTQRRQ